MPIVIKEVVVKTTVERKNSQWSQPDEDLIDSLKQRVLDELRVERILKGEKSHGRERKKR